jgi:hypothetical protein
VILAASWALAAGAEGDIPLRNASPAAEAATTYDVRVAGAAAGTRTVTVRWTPREGGGERRIVEVRTEVELPTGAWLVRSTGSVHGRTASFTTVGAAGPDRWEVQARRARGGPWDLRVTAASGATSRTDPAALSTLDLFDPARNVEFCEPGPLRVLVAETGDGWDGEALPSEPVDVRVGGVVVPGTRCTVRGSDGALTVERDGAGGVLRAVVRLRGVDVGFLARRPPPPRTWEVAAPVPGFGDDGGALREETLRP